MCQSNMKHVYYTTYTGKDEYCHQTIERKSWQEAVKKARARNPAKRFKLNVRYKNYVCPFGCFFTITRKCVRRGGKSKQ